VKKIPFLICAAMCASMAVSCGNKDKGDGIGHLYNAALQGNPQSLDPQYANDASSNTVIKNMYSGLMQTEPSGAISCCNASKYSVSPDGLTYTFELRKDNYWFKDDNGNDIIEKSEYFPVTAKDYVFAFQRLLDPKMQSPYAECYSCIKGGEDIISGRLSPDEAGVKAVDDYTLEITLDYPSAEFLRLLALSPASPCNEEFFLSTKGRYGLDDKSVMSNGAFYMRQWYYDPYGHHNILYMKKCDINANLERQVLPSYLSFTIEKNEDDVRQCFKDDEIECFTTLSSSYSSSKYSVTEKSAVTLGLVFNQKEGYFKSEDLRKALSLSIDRTKLADELSDDVEAACGIVPPAVEVAGKKYRDQVSDKIFDVYKPDEAAECVQRAKEELNVGSFNNVKILICADTIDSGYVHLLSQQWQDVTGVYIGIEEVKQDEFYQRLENGDYSVALYPLKADLNSTVSLFSEFENDSILKKDSDGRKRSLEILHCDSVPHIVEKCTGFERELLDAGDFVPVFYKNSYLVAYDDNDDIIYDPFSGSVDFRIARNYS